MFDIVLQFRWCAPFLCLRDNRKTFVCKADSTTLMLKPHDNAFVFVELLVFRAVSGMGMTVESWLQGIPENLNDPACANSGERSCSFFRHHLVNSWGSFSTAHLRIKYALHKDPNEQEVAYITFNGSESATLEDWFTADRIIGSSWSDLTLSTTFLDFTIKGTWIGHERWFRALTSWGSCATDGGYTLVVTGQGIYSCSYDYHDSYPQFYFSINTGPCYFDTYDFVQADAMTILIYVE